MAGGGSKEANTAAPTAEGERGAGATSGGVSNLSMNQTLEGHEGSVVRNQDKKKECKKRLHEVWGSKNVFRFSSLVDVYDRLRLLSYLESGNSR